MGWLTNRDQEDEPDVVRIRTDSEWHRLLDRSSSDPVLLLKHSTVCNVSACVYSEFREFLTHHPAAAAGVVHVIEDRAVSDEICRWTGIRHESPQVLLVREREAVWHASHWDIDFDDLDRTLTA